LESPKGANLNPAAGPDLQPQTGGDIISESGGEYFSERRGDIISECGGGLPRNQHPNRSKVHDSHPDYRVFAAGSEVGAGWVRTGERSGKDYVSLSMAAPEFGPRVIYANLGRAAGQDDDDVFAIIWNPAD
jgi:uncharacterized protein (DUF736 family)